MAAVLTGDIGALGALAEGATGACALATNARG